MQSSLRSASYWEIFLWLLRHYRRVRVTGNSMLPLLSPENEVLLDPAAYTKSLPKQGDIVIADHPHQPKLSIIKRVDFVEPNGLCYLKGDNPDASSDSRQFGLVSQVQLQGKVICRFP